ncbi:GxxExxY protein [candidate division KSB1 bacterium]|nr:GxxExxY protein [candidate division KSB1 bacterium]
MAFHKTQKFPADRNNATDKKQKQETEGNKMELIYEDSTRELIGCFFDVHNSLGVGYDEPAYHKALQRSFCKKGFEHRSEERKALLHRARKVREFKADLITRENNSRKL